jgi:hypothetical protein
MTWACGDCGTEWHEAVGTCIFCLTTDLAACRRILEGFAIDASLLLDTLPADIPTGFQSMSASAVSDRIGEAWELLGTLPA